MTRRKLIAPAPWIFPAAFLLACSPLLRADETNVETRLRLLQQQNDALQSQLRQQQELIDSLRREVGEIRRVTAQQENAMQDVKAALPAPGAAAQESGGFHAGKVVLSGEGAVAFFETGSRGAFPHNEFR